MVMRKYRVGFKLIGPNWAPHWCYLLSPFQVHTITHCKIYRDKGNSKITEHRAIFQRERPNSYVNKPTQSVNNRKTGKNRDGPDLVQAFPKKWWVESDFLRHNTSRFHYGQKVPVVTITAFEIKLCKKMTV